MKSKIFKIVAISIFLPSIGFSGEVITANEIQNCFYADGKMECSEGEFKNTYYRDGDKIIRTHVYNFKNNQSISDDTVYEIVGELASDPKNNTGKILVLPKIERGIGFPGADAMEIISINKNFIQTVKSTSDYFVISRFKIIKE